MNRILFYAFFLVLNLSYAQNRFPTAGSVGIGTTEPLYDLDVRGDGFFSGAITTSRSGEMGGQMRIVNPSKLSSGTANSWIIYNMTGGYGNSLQFWAYDNLGCVGGMCSNRFTIMDNGNVGIGESNPKNKLDVKGIIHSQEVNVDMDNWSDFVFKKEYNLPTLTEVEKHIAEKGHLENIPSEEEVLKNGISLGQMNSKLLQKIEELTLYAIEQEKNNNKQSLRIELLEKENEVLKNVLERLSNIEEKLK